MTTADAVRERALTLARATTDRDEAIRDLQESCGDRRVSVGNLVTAAITGNDAVWDIPAWTFAQIVLANVLGMLIGFTLGVLFRSSPAAIVGYFVYSLVLPAALGALAAFQEWFRDAQPWVDVNYAITRLFDNSMTAEYWQQLGVTTLVWLWIPLAIGLRAVLRAEVK